MGQPAAAVLLDANVWVSERMLQSPLGSAMLYAAVESGVKIALPESVEREVDAVLVREFERRIDGLEQSAAWLRQFTARHVSIAAPTHDAASSAMKARWNQLAGALHRVPLNLIHVHRALDRIIRKDVPCGSNNEQFRDCCIWEVALELAEGGPVHLVTADTAFYEGRSNSGRLAGSLEREAARLKRTVYLHKGLESLLSTSDVARRPVDEEPIKIAIIDLVLPTAAEVAAANPVFTLGEPARVRINGFATPDASTVAVSFTVWFETKFAVEKDGAEQEVTARLTVGGSLFWDPGTAKAKDGEITRWTKSMEGKGGPFMATSWDPQHSAQFEQNQVRHF